MDCTDDGIKWRAFGVCERTIEQGCTGERPEQGECSLVSFKRCSLLLRGHNEIDVRIHCHG